jgi:hypothetical protein
LPQCSAEVSSARDSARIEHVMHMLLETPSGVPTCLAYIVWQLRYIEKHGAIAPEHENLLDLRF